MLFNKFLILEELRKGRATNFTEIELSTFVIRVHRSC